MEILTLKLSAIQVLGLSCIGLVAGNVMRRLLPVLQRLSVPSSILGGLIFALLGLAMRGRVCNFTFDLVLRDVLMIAFFTTIGMGASLRLLKVGGRRVSIFLAAAVLGLLAQVVFGAVTAKAMGLPALFGMIPGAVSLTGGPATALAFGPVFEQAGIAGATTIGLASAVFGIVASGLLGGYVGGFLIKRHGLRPEASELVAAPEIDVDGGPGEKHGSYLDNIIALGIAMALGSLVSVQFKAWGLTMPAYIGAMLVAGVLRNLDDAFQWIGIEQEKMDEIGTIALELFIVMALLTLELWHLSTLALPVIAILTGQVILTIGLAWTAIYWMMGRNYTSAVMAGGYCGFMLGTTANAMACMREITRQHGPAPHAFFAVSIVGAFLIDFINALLVTQSLNILK